MSSASESSPAAPIDALTIAAGSAPVDVIYKTGKPARVFVMLCEIDQLGKFLHLGDDELRLAEFLTGNAEGWAKTLKPESVMDIAEKGMDLNFTLAKRYAERRLAVVKAAAPFDEFARKRSDNSSASSAPTSG